MLGSVVTSKIAYMRRVILTRGKTTILKFEDSSLSRTLLDLFQPAERKGDQNKFDSTRYRFVY